MRPLRLATAALLVSWPALAGTVNVTSSGEPVVISLDGEIVGQTPMELDVGDGRHQIGFWDPVTATMSFERTVEVAASGRLNMTVDMPGQTATVSAGSAKPASSSLTDALDAASAPAPKPEPEPEPEPVITSPATKPPMPPVRAWGDLFVNSDVAGAFVQVDGLPTGKQTPAMLEKLPVGQHSVVVSKDCQGAVADIEVLDSRIERLDLVLEDGAADLSVTSTPAGAAVLLDGRSLGVTPVSAEGAGCGAAALEVKLAGYAPEKLDVQLGAFQQVDLDFTLTPASFGTLAVAVKPYDAEVWLDGEKRATGPITLDDVTVGMHDLVVVADGYISHAARVLVAESTVTRLDVELATGDDPAPVVAAAPVEDTTPASAPEPAPEPEPIAPDPVPEPEPAATEPAEDDPVAPSGDDPASNTGRLVLNGSVSVLAIGLGAGGLSSYLQAKDAYDRYLDVGSEAAAVSIYNTEFLPARSRALALGGASAVVAAGAATLWITTDLQVAPTPGGAVLLGSW